MIKNYFLIITLLISATFLNAQDSNSFNLKSPDGDISVTIDVDDKLKWSVAHKGQEIISPSDISLLLQNGNVLGNQPKIISSPTESVNETFTTINYKKAEVKDHYNQLTLNCRGDYGLIFRAFDDGVAYRFFTKKKGEIVIENEEVNFNFSDDHKAFIPIQWDYRGGQNFNSSYEALYHEINLSHFPEDSLAFLPLLVDVGQNKKVVILEADLENYPGMFMDLNETGKGLKGDFAPYPLETAFGGHNNQNIIPTKRADYIAKTSGTRTFPWRAIVISEHDKELLNNDMVQKLASPSRIKNTSWIEPGQSAWDWWNASNIKHVDFKSGMNTDTYKYFVDFASANKIKYIIIDAGWSETMDLFSLEPNLNLKEVISHGNEKNVGVILWATWAALVEQVDKAFPHYAQMGAKGFKIDFIDRDDQLAVASTYEIAKKGADHKLLIDYHGVFKPTGLQRTYPNVIGYEGVKGLENFKWADEDAPRYAVSIPFIRMMAGPMDYTSGAMRNANKANYRVIENNPMSKGTRSHQLAQYVMYEAPFQMLSDNPSIYMQEQESTDFITSIPVTFDETVALDGKVGEFAAIARRNGDVWYVGAMTNWDARELTLDFSFLGEGNYEAVIFKDGMNADRDATDYKREVLKITSNNKIEAKLYPGGGWVARITKIN